MSPNAFTGCARRIEYSSIQARLETFANWPENHHVTREAAADAGFYYAGYSDCVRCYHCGCGLRNWQPEDDVWLEHARVSPRCELVLQKFGQDVVDASSSSPRETPYQDMKMRYPMRGEFAALEKRLETFAQWPASHHITREMAANAGFYYVGYSDCVRCFFCGGGLRNWEPTDDVTIEHTRYFPRCGLIHKMFGTEFVEVVVSLAKDFEEVTMEIVESELRRRKSERDHTQTANEEAQMSIPSSKL